MARLDLYHNLVKSALQNEGWLITHDPYRMKIEDVRYEIDLGAEMLLGAEKDGEKIAVEIKSFLEQSTVHAFHTAIGQFLDYLVALEEEEPDRVLFIAVPQAIYESFFVKRIIQKTLKRAGAKIIVFDVENQTIVRWIR
ncbi:MAG: element excision factor XisH family protein [Saprospiraceae bacterium]